MDANIEAPKILEKVSLEKIQAERAPSPSETIITSLQLVDQIVRQKGTGTYSSKKDISIITGKAEPTLVLKLSTAVQYNLLSNKFGTGYTPTKLYESYLEPTYEEDKKKFLLQMLQSPQLYQKLLEDFNGKILPPEQGLINHVKNVYKLNPNSAERAVKIFLENVRHLSVVDSNNRLRFILPDVQISESVRDQEAPPPPPPPPPPDPLLFRLPIKLPGKGDRIAYFEYPNDLNKRDFKVIAKALTFVASSLIIDEHNEDYELIINVTETDKKNGNAD